MLCVVQGQERHAVFQLLLQLVRESETADVDLPNKRSVSARRRGKV
jgi:hypothetical protein